MIIIYRAVWHERPYEVDFFEKSSEFERRVVGKWSKHKRKGLENGRRETVLSISWTKIDRRRSRKVMGGLRTPKNDIKK